MLISTVLQHPSDCLLLTDLGETLFPRGSEDQLTHIAASASPYLLGGHPWQAAPAWEIAWGIVGLRSSRTME